METGTSIAEVCWKYGVAEQTVYRWCSKYGELETSELQRLRELEAENSRLKKIVAQQVLDIDTLKDLSQKRVVSLRARRNAVEQLACQHPGSLAPSSQTLAD